LVGDYEGIFQSRNSLFIILLAQNPKNNQSEEFYLHIVVYSKHIVGQSKKFLQMPKSLTPLLTLLMTDKQTKFFVTHCIYIVYSVCTDTT
jgi:hypothetical protein